jgi:hypothetical protein
MILVNNGRFYLSFFILIKILQRRGFSMGANYSGCAYYRVPNDWEGDVPLSICVSTDYLNVKVSMETQATIGAIGWWYDWKMELQRYDGGWKTVGSRTGWLSADSPSNRTFTNVLVSGKKMRVKVTFKYENYKGQIISFVRYSKTWTR